MTRFTVKKLGGCVLAVGLVPVVGLANARPAATQESPCPANTTEQPLSWGANGTVQWPGAGNDQSDGSSTTFANWADSGVDMTMTISDPDNRNSDADNELEALGQANVPGWGPTFGFTQTDGTFGDGFLTFNMNSLHEDEEVSLTWTFSSPVMIPSFSVGDIDNIGLGFSPGDEPYDSYQDEVEFTASLGGSDVPVALDPQGGASPLISGQTALGGPYIPGQTGDVSPGNPVGTVVATPAGTIDSLTIVYSNGPDDEAAEAGPSFPPPAPLPPDASAVSDSHLIRVNTATVCVPEPASIGGRVYVDTNGNGLFDEGEDPIPGTTVTLNGTDEAGNPINRTTTTDDSGQYLFSGLPPGTYTVTETQPEGFDDGGENAGSNGGTVTNDAVSTITLEAGDNATDYNFGEIPPPTPPPPTTTPEEPEEPGAPAAPPATPVRAKPTFTG